MILVPFCLAERRYSELRPLEMRPTADVSGRVYDADALQS